MFEKEIKELEKKFKYAFDCSNRQYGIIIGKLIAYTDAQAQVEKAKEELKDKLLSREEMLLPLDIRRIVDEVLGGKNGSKI